jgi:succinate dehydrogenase hydrophobic anchor subunit
MYKLIKTAIILVFLNIILSLLMFLIPNLNINYDHVSAVNNLIGYTGVVLFFIPACLQYMYRTKANDKYKKMVKILEKQKPEIFLKEPIPEKYTDSKENKHPEVSVKDMTPDDRELIVAINTIRDSTLEDAPGVMDAIYQSIFQKYNKEDESHEKSN